MQLPPILILFMAIFVDGLQASVFVRNINETTCERKIIDPSKMVPTKVDIICCKGYMRKGRECVAKCDQVCENSKCTAPNHCDCNDGYKPFNQYRCLPDCENCLHGTCVAPNICDCFSGYKNNGTNGGCLPRCQQPCRNGECVAPDKCKCMDGYEPSDRNPFDCQPVCSAPCVQGRCVGPDQCECFPGYQLKTGSPFECLPVCDYCERGKNCSATASSHCTCWESYEHEDIQQGNSTIRICRPQCSIGCVNGDCIEVDTCSCHDGYAPSNGSEHICEPLCFPPCENGQCIGPDECLCDEGYAAAMDSCHPQCESACLNGHCVTPPNTCECAPDYEMTDAENNVCQAICNPPCENGLCVEPNKCECFENYTMLANGSNVCVMETGQCTAKCPNGFCVRSNECECLSDFYMETNGDCVPICDPPCRKNFFCRVPGQCECLLGYASEQNECVPMCKNCHNGWCSHPEKCVCTDNDIYHEKYGCIPDDYDYVTEDYSWLFSTDTITNLGWSESFRGRHRLLTTYLIVLLLVTVVFVAILIFIFRWRRAKVVYSVTMAELKRGVQYNVNKDDVAYA